MLLVDSTSGNSRSLPGWKSKSNRRSGSLQETQEEQPHAFEIAGRLKENTIPRSFLEEEEVMDSWWSHRRSWGEPNRAPKSQDTQTCNDLHFLVFRTLNEMCFEKFVFRFWFFCVGNFRVANLSFWKLFCHNRKSIHTVGFQRFVHQVDESRCLGTMVPVIPITWERLIFYMGVRRYCITCFALRILEVWRSHPELWRLSFVTRKIPARWTLHMCLSDCGKSACALQMNCFAFLLCLLDNLLFAFDFTSCHDDKFFSFLILCQLRPSRPVSSLSEVRDEVCAQYHDDSDNWTLFFSSTMGSSWPSFPVSGLRRRYASLAYSCENFFFSRGGCWRSLLAIAHRELPLVGGQAPLAMIFRKFHGIAEFVYITTSFAHFQGFVEFLVFWIDVRSSNQLPCTVELWLSFCPNLFSIPVPYFWPIVLGPGPCLNLCQFPVDHVHPRGGSFWRVTGCSQSMALIIAELHQRAKNHQADTPATRPMWCFSAWICELTLFGKTAKLKSLWRNAGICAVQRWDERHHWERIPRRWLTTASTLITTPNNNLKRAPAYELTNVSESEFSVSPLVKPLIEHRQWNKLEERPYLFVFSWNPRNRKNNWSGLTALLSPGKQDRVTLSFRPKKRTALSEQDSCTPFGSRLDFLLCECITTSFLALDGMCDELDTECPLLEC